MQWHFIFMSSAVPEKLTWWCNMPPMYVYHLGALYVRAGITGDQVVYVVTYDFMTV